MSWNNPNHECHDVGCRCPCTCGHQGECKWCKIMESRTKESSATYAYPHDEARRAVEDGAPIIESVTFTSNESTKDKGG